MKVIKNKINGLDWLKKSKTEIIEISSNFIKYKHKSQILELQLTF